MKKFITFILFFYVFLVMLYKIMELNIQISEIKYERTKIELEYCRQLDEMYSGLDKVMKIVEKNKEERIFDE